MSGYHSALGLSGGESQPEIEAAYRELAKKYHPDRNKGDKKAAEKFKEINSAYAAIKSNKPPGHVPSPQNNRDSDSIFRERREKHGDEYYREQNNRDRTEHRWERGFRDILNNNYIFGEHGDYKFDTGPGIKVDATIDFDQAVRGDTIEVETNRGFKFELEVPSCSRDGAELIKRNHIGPDFSVKLHVLPHGIWERADLLNIHKEIAIDPLDAEMGGVVFTENYYGKRVKVPIPQGAKNGKMIGISGAGLEKNGHFGDLFLTLNLTDFEKPVSVKKSRKWARKKKSKKIK